MQLLRFRGMRGFQSQPQFTRLELSCMHDKIVADFTRNSPFVVWVQEGALITEANLGISTLVTVFTSGVLGIWVMSGKTAPARVTRIFLWVIWLYRLNIQHYGCMTWMISYLYESFCFFQSSHCICKRVIKYCHNGFSALQDILWDRLYCYSEEVRHGHWIRAESTVSLLLV